MGSFLSSRREEATQVLDEALQAGDSTRLRFAIAAAECSGVDVMPYRIQYSELVRREWQSADQADEMFEWAFFNDDEDMLFDLLEQVSTSTPNHRSLPMARSQAEWLWETNLLRSDSANYEMDSLRA